MGSCSPQLALGRALRSFRLERGYSQEELAARSGLHRNYIGGIERGERNPTLMSLLAVAQALEVRLSEVVLRLEADLD